MAYAQLRSSVPLIGFPQQPCDDAPPERKRERDEKSRQDEPQNWRSFTSMSICAMGPGPVGPGPISRKPNC
jgi:hypothetical protein